MTNFLQDFVNKSRLKRFKRQVYQTAPHVDEDLVSAFLNSPEAVKMVLSYLGTQKRTTTTTPRPRPPRRIPNIFSIFLGGKKPPLQKSDGHRKKNIIEQKLTPTTTSSSSPPVPIQNVGKLQFFGPKDFVPKAPHKLPALRPMRLKYSSTKDFPSKAYGGRLVPMPR